MLRFMGGMIYDFHDKQAVFHARRLIGSIVVDDQRAIAKTTGMIVESIFCLNVALHTVAVPATHRVEACMRDSRTDTDNRHVWELFARWCPPLADAALVSDTLAAARAAVQAWRASCDPSPSSGLDAGPSRRGENLATSNAARTACAARATLDAGVAIMRDAPITMACRKELIAVAGGNDRAAKRALERLVGAGLLTCVAGAYSRTAAGNGATPEQIAAALGAVAG